LLIILRRFFSWEDRMLVAGLSVTSLPWRSELAELKGRLACVFQRSETREQVGLYLDGLQPTMHFLSAPPSTQRSAASF
jgi:hypothetical protein